MIGTALLLPTYPTIPHMILLQHFHPVLFDHRVGQHVAGDLLDFGASPSALGARSELDLEALTLTDIEDRRWPCPASARTDRLALRIEDRFLERDEDASFHGMGDFIVTRLHRAVRASADTERERGGGFVRYCGGIRSCCRLACIAARKPKRIWPESERLPDRGRTNQADQHGARSGSRF